MTSGTRTFLDGAYASPGLSACLVRTRRVAVTQGVRDPCGIRTDTGLEVHARGHGRAAVLIGRRLGARQARDGARPLGSRQRTTKRAHPPPTVALWFVRFAASVVVLPPDALNDQIECFNQVRLANLRAV